MKNLILVIILTITGMASEDIEAMSIIASLENNIKQMSPETRPEAAKVKYKKEVTKISKVIYKYKKSIPYTKEVVKSVIRVSEETGIPAEILLASSIQESSVNPKQKHSYVKVRVFTDKSRTNTKVIKTRALGMNGVIYEIHKYRLKKIGINSAEELFNPLVSLRAMAKILSDYKKLRKIGGASTKIESALMRYYGFPKSARGRADSRKYMRSILNKASKIDIGV